MPFFDYFRNFIVGRTPFAPDDERSYDRRGERFRNPIWQTGEDDDDDDDFRQQGQPGDIMHFRIFTDPMEITRYFEAQMDSMMKEFFQGFGNNNDFSHFPENPPPKTSLRDSFLKGGDSGLEHSDVKIDQDLDGKITTNDFSIIWKNNDETNQIPVHSPSKSVQKVFLRKPDGRVEHKEIIRDSDGNEKTIISRQIGDKKYTVTTQRDKDGVETKTEDLVNMDESDLKFFSENWTPVDYSIKHNSILDTIAWEKLFGLDLK